MSEGWKLKRNPRAIGLIMTIATFTEVLDTSIANVVLSHNSESLGPAKARPLG